MSYRIQKGFSTKTFRHLCQSFKEDLSLEGREVRKQLLICNEKRNKITASRWHAEAVCTASGCQRSIEVLQFPLLCCERMVFVGKINCAKLVSLLGIIFPAGFNCWQPLSMGLIVFPFYVREISPLIIRRPFCLGQKYFQKDKELCTLQISLEVHLDKMNIHRILECIVHKIALYL